MILSTRAAASATITDPQIPFTPKKPGRIRMLSTSKTSVLANEIRADTGPLFKAVKNEEANILKPMKRKATEYILKALTVKFISSASYPTNIEDIKPEPSSEAIVTITEKMPVRMRKNTNATRSMLKREMALRSL